MPNAMKKVALPLGLLAAALVLAEVLLRVTGFAGAVPERRFGAGLQAALEQGRLQADGELFWVPAPDLADSLPNALHPDLPVPAPDGRPRVLVLGDGCSRESGRGRPYPVVLQERLADDGTQVFNASVQGYTSEQGLAWLRSRLLDLEPDVVVVHFGWNDHWRARGGTDREAAAARRPSRLRLAALLPARTEAAPLRVPLGAYRENLEAIVAEVRGSGGRVVLIAAPHVFDSVSVRLLIESGDLTPADDVRTIHGAYLDVVRSFGGRDGVAVLSADRLFDNLGRRVPLLHRDGIHLTDDAHRAVGAALAVLIRDGDGADGTIPPRLLTAARLAISTAARQEVLR